VRFKLPPRLSERATGTSADSRARSPLAECGQRGLAGGVGAPTGNRPPCTTRDRGDRSDTWVALFAGDDGSNGLEGVCENKLPRIRDKTRDHLDRHGPLQPDEIWKEADSSCVNSTKRCRRASSCSAFSSSACVVFLTISRSTMDPMRR
jgi:hypothetical protein